MANDIKIVSNLSPEATMTCIVTAGTTASIDVGQPTKRYDATAASWTGAVAIMIDGDGSTASAFTGISKNASTETASAAGVVTVWMPLPGLIYSGVAKSSTAANTAAKVNGLLWKRVVFDLTSSVWTIDTAATDAASSGLVIVGGDYQTNTVYFTIKSTLTALGQIA
jgi:hypothetical protein